MSADTRACPSCRGATTLQMVPSATGREEPLAVTLRGLPVLRCSEGHTHFVSIEFPLKLLEHLVREDEKQLPVADKKGLIFKHFHCSKCEKELLPKPDHRHVFEIDLTLPGITPFVGELSMPVYKCAGCGMEQLHSLDEIRNHTAGALAKAFEDAGVAREA